MRDFLHHLFLPRESNNYRPKILHHKSILFVIIALFLGQFLLTSIKTKFPDVLGTTTNISTQDLLTFTNQNRQKEGLVSLSLNNQLSEAALLKAKDMFEKNYWAHNAPEGTTPWVFIKKAGYDYIYAGENLARGFNSSGDVVNAWMASPKHRENLLSGNYNDVGFAIASGKLNGEESVLVVEMLGGKGASPLARKTSEQVTPVSQAPVPQEAPKVVSYQPTTSFQPLVASVKVKPLIDINVFSQSLSLSVVFLFISVFIVDMIIIERKKIVRVLGHNLDHILFLTGILLTVILFSRGFIL